MINQHSLDEEYIRENRHLALFLWQDEQIRQKYAAMRGKTLPQWPKQKHDAFFADIKTLFSHASSLQRVAARECIAIPSDIAGKIHAKLAWMQEEFKYGHNELAQKLYEFYARQSCGVADQPKKLSCVQDTDPATQFRKIFRNAAQRYRLHERCYGDVDAKMSPDAAANLLERTQACFDAAARYIGEQEKSGQPVLCSVARPMLFQLELMSEVVSDNIKDKKMFDTNKSTVDMLRHYGFGRHEI